MVWGVYRLSTTTGHPPGSKRMSGECLPPPDPDSFVERDRIIMQAICDHKHPTMSLNDLGFSGVIWAKAFTRVRKRFAIERAPIGRKRYCTPDEKTKERMRDAISEDTIRITSRQHGFLLALSGGHLSCKDVANAIGVSYATAALMLRRLRDAGVVRMRHISGKLYVYELTAPYSELEKRIYVSDAHTGPPVSDMEARYYAILRNSGLTGLTLSDQYRKIFPHRSEKSVASNVHRIATKKRWCR